LLKWAANSPGRSVTGSVNSGMTNFTVQSGTPLTSADVGAAISGTGIPAGDTIATVTNATHGTLLVAATSTHANEALAITADAGGPDSLTGVSNAAYRACTAPCMTTLTFTSTNGGANSAFKSAPYYDYATDTLYAGDDGPSGAPGVLHKFTGVFLGTPAEVTTNPWPVAIANGDNLLLPPVYDSASGNVLVADFGSLTGGVSSGFHSVKGSTGAIVGTSNALGISAFDAPLVDSNAARAYVFDSDNGVYQFATTFSSGSGTLKALGTVSTTIALYDGNFDNAYFSSPSQTGNIYVCGNVGGNATLYQVPISANTMGTPKALTTTLTTANTTCSPVTEVYNTTATNGPFDWIYLGVQASGRPAACGGAGCIMNFLVTAWTASNPYTLNQEVLDSNLNVEKVTTAGTSGGSQPTWNVTTGGTTHDGGVTWTNQGSMALAANSTATAQTGGTSGIIIDNTSSAAGASQIYFSTLGNGTCPSSGSVPSAGGCAVQASQAAP